MLHFVRRNALHFTSLPRGAGVLHAVWPTPAQIGDARSPHWMESVMATQVHDHVELTTKEARQGEGSRRVNWVLTVSLSLAILAGVAIYYSFF